MENTALPPKADPQTPSFIQDEAVSEDFFGSHKPVADSIAAVIRKERHLRVIGLLGSWGSGKSTVLNILKTNLERNNGREGEIRFFNYDAWVHQSDPPRRSFLETLVEFLEIEGLISKDQWRNDLDRLNRRIEEHDVRTTPTLTISGKVIASAFLFFPVGLTLVNPVWISKPFEPFGFNTGINIIPLGVALLMVPLLAASLIFYLWRPNRNPFSRSFFKRSNWTQHRPPHQDSTIFSIFVNRAVDRVTNRIVRAPDPTAIEFQETYHRLMAAVARPNRQFVFVIDNLDRIPETEAITLWSTVRSFFLPTASAGFSRRLEFTPPIVILPLDPKTVRRMYGKDNSEAEELAQSFLDKTFDLVFRVAPPVLSDWHSYLEAKLREAFGASISDNDVYSTSKLFASYLHRKTVVEKRAQNVTPRMIIKLVNAIVTLKLQYKDEISLASIAYYAIHKDRIEEDVNTILLATEADIERFEPDWRTSIAAIFYGVAKGKALQVLMQSSVESSITDANIETFAPLVKVPGFDSVLEQAIEKITGTTPLPIEVVTNAAYLIEETQVPPSTRIKAVQRNLRRALAASQDWKKITNATPVGIVALLKSSETNEIATVTRSVFDKLSKVDQEFISSANAANIWVAVAIASFDFLKTRGVTPEVVGVPGGANFFMAVLKELVGNPELLRLVRPKVPANEVIQLLASTASAAKFGGDTQGTLRLLINMGTQWPWSALVEAAADFVRQQPVDNTGTGTALECLQMLRSESQSDASQALKRLSDEGHLFDKLHNAHVNNAYQAEAAIIVALILVNPSFAKPAAVGSSDAGHQLAANLSSALVDRQQQIDDEIGRQLTEYSSISEMVSVVTANSATRPLIQRLITKRVGDSRVGHLDVKDVIGRLLNYVNLIDSPQRELFFRKLPSYSGFWEELRAAPFGENKFEILRWLTALNDESGDRARDDLLESANRLTSEEWEQILEDGREPIPLLLNLPGSGVKDAEFGDPLLQALRIVLARQLSTGKMPTELVQRLCLLAQSLSPSSRGILYKDVRDRMFSAGTAPGLLSILIGGGMTMLSEGQFSDRSDDAVRYVVIPLVDKLPDGLEWLRKNKEVLAVWIGKADNGTRDYLSEKLKSEAEAEDQMIASRVQELAASWKFTLPKRELSEGPESGDAHSSEKQ
jgi:hypothetical protein